MTAFFSGVIIASLVNKYFNRMHISLTAIANIPSWLAEWIPFWAIGPAFFFIVLFSLWLVKRFLYVYLRALNHPKNYNWSGITVRAANRPLSLLIVTISLKATEKLVQLYDETVITWATQINTVALLLTTVSMLVFTDHFARMSITRIISKGSGLRSSGTLLRGLLRGVIIIIGVLFILSNIGISITPFVASLGIGSLAVALALQPTLENFFSGIQMLADKPIRVGDFIELDSGEQGFVEKIGWRSTWIKMLPNNIVIMPNSKLAQSKIINYYYPEKQLSVPVDLGVHYDSDLEHVEKVTLEVAKQVLKNHKWGIPEYDTFVIFTGFDDSSINLTVMLRAQEYFNRFFIRSEFIKALHKRYAQEGIVIPYPIRAVNLNQEGSADTLKR
ncbi:mechanosensitive ion channel [Paraglaciecola aquimarina]|uniref:Mechanosensitive ion channel n=1 Tax=Paraglaciecola algarum TaxID=3050085 RepID=A0ABS9D1Z3_9ALTE|nr:mechanosensitive ion channel family protein [Paraglaciecola sp. G1-23]MCF2946517.1 mechanosensitive ion channel [Paraglaciecola sp. G1-23]